jgi:hypothetical protein
MNPFTRTYFTSPVPERAPRYRVRVYAYDRIESPSRDQ